MEEELETRLDGVYFETKTFTGYPPHMIDVTILTLEAVRTHIQKLHHGSVRDQAILATAIEIIKGLK